MKKYPEFRLWKRVILAVLIFTFFSGCIQKKPLKIAISKATPNYIHWIRQADSVVQLVDLYQVSSDSALKILDECSALLLTGGEDIYPGNYGKTSDTGKCTGFDRRRDTAEFSLLQKALALKMPVLGICRGNQLINVSLGGTLTTDIPSEIEDAGIHQCEDYLHCFHVVYLEKNSLLRSFAGCDSAMVTTNHHQTVGKLSTRLKVNALSTDGLTEGIEWIDPQGKSFLLGVQWHPERMKKSNPLSGSLANELIRQAELFHKNH
ncbi:MAG: gamma-glutamyl-gamma-aminobutyrate hydrolase family protein [bacterium]